MRVPEQPPSHLDIVFRRANDVANMFQDTKFQAFLDRSKSHYWNWDKIRMIAREEQLDPELVWTHLKLSRISQYQAIPLRGSSSHSLRFTMPALVQRELMLIDQELAGRIGFAQEQPLNKSIREQFIISALMEEAIASSKLEGATTTRRVAKDMLRQNRRPRDNGERMIVNNYKTILYIREHRDAKLTPELLIELQRMITEGTIPPDQVGRLRNSDEDIVVEDKYGEIMHRPPPADELPARLEELCSFANSSHQDSNFIHPVIKACILHFQVGFDHPFCDGNGRTARTLFYWSMLRDGYWLFEYLPISRLIYKSPAKYGRAFLYTESDEFDVTYFLVYKLKLISRARQELQEYLARKQSQLAQTKKIFEGDSTFNHRQQSLMLHAVRNPDAVYTIEGHRNSHSIAFATARADLLDLMNRGFLLQSKISNRYEFRPSSKLDKPLKLLKGTFKL